MAKPSTGEIRWLNEYGFFGADEPHPPPRLCGAGSRSALNDLPEVSSSPVASGRRFRLMRLVVSTQNRSLASCAWRQTLWAGALRVHAVAGQQISRRPGHFGGERRRQAGEHNVQTDTDSSAGSPLTGLGEDEEASWQPHRQGKGLRFNTEQRGRGRSGRFNSPSATSKESTLCRTAVKCCPLASSVRKRDRVEAKEVWSRQRHVFSDQRRRYLVSVEQWRHRQVRAPPTPWARLTRHSAMNTASSSSRSTSRPMLSLAVLDAHDVDGGVERQENGDQETAGSAGDHGCGPTP